MGEEEDVPGGMPPSKFSSSPVLPPEETFLVFYLNGTDSVHDMRVVNTDAKSQLAKTPENCLQEAEWAKKNIYLEA